MVDSAKTAGNQLQAVETNEETGRDRMAIIFPIGAEHSKFCDSPRISHVHGRDNHAVANVAIVPRRREVAQQSGPPALTPTISQPLNPG